jgi:hypothetical protein
LTNWFLSIDCSLSMKLLMDKDIEHSYLSDSLSS